MTKALDELIAAAEAYGDAQAECDRAVRAWKQGDPMPHAPKRLSFDLLSAARKYATSTRKKRQRRPKS